MERSLRRKLAIGATGLLVLGGAGVAYGVTSSGGNDKQAFLNDVAKRLNVTPDQLNNALKGAFADRLDAAVKAGRLTQAQADAIKKKVEQGGGVPFLGPGLRPGFGFGFGIAGPKQEGLDAAAKYLGLTDQQLFNKLQSGKSLADIAGDENKSVDGLKSAIRDAVKSDLDGAVKNGKLSQTEENKILGGLDSRLDDLVNAKGPHIRVKRGFGFGFGFGFGDPGAPRHEGLDAVANYLGLGDQQLFNKLRSGKSLADIAKDENKSVDGLKSAIRAGVKSDLDDAVKKGVLTQTQENKALSALDSNLDDLVNGKTFRVGPGFGKRQWGPRHGGFQFHFGAAPAAPPSSPSPSSAPII